MAFHLHGVLSQQAATCTVSWNKNMLHPSMIPEEWKGTWSKQSPTVLLMRRTLAVIAIALAVVTGGPIHLKVIPGTMLWYACAVLCEITLAGRWPAHTGCLFELCVTWRRGETSTSINIMKKALVIYSRWIMLVNIWSLSFWTVILRKDVKRTWTFTDICLCHHFLQLHSHLVTVA